MPEPLDYQSPQPNEPPNHYVAVASRVAALILAVVNSVAVICAACLPDFGPIIVTIAAIPINLLLICCSCMFIPMVRHHARGTPVTTYILIGTLSPIVAFFITCICMIAIIKMRQ